jgi:hypothetical protein
MCDPRDHQSSERPFTHAFSKQFMYATGPKISRSSDIFFVTGYYSNTVVPWGGGRLGHVPQPCVCVVEESTAGSTVSDGC